MTHSASPSAPVAPPDPAGRLDADPVETQRDHVPTPLWTLVVGSVGVSYSSEPATASIFHVARTMIFPPWLKTSMSATFGLFSTAVLRSRQSW